MVVASLLKSEVQYITKVYQCDEGSLYTGSSWQPYTEIPSKSNMCTLMFTDDDLDEEILLQDNHHLAPGSLQH